ncbi:hypothetical protein BJY00DRAFT_315597 [Aspergillus carlsbadensis]|nr:hypothetical protein BJY00DRAFT_315597 [Aspergillus carlsbadensis]
MEPTPSDHDGSLPLARIKQALEALSRFAREHRQEDIDTAVRLARAAVDDAGGLSVDADRKCQALAVLAAVLQKRYQSATAKDSSDLDEAVDATRAAVTIVLQECRHETGRGVSDAPVYFTNFERAICFRYNASGEGLPAEDPVPVVNAVLDLAQRGSAYHAWMLKVLAGVCTAVYHKTKTRRYLDQAIDAAKLALSITPTDHPYGKVMSDVLEGLYDNRLEGSTSIDEVDELIALSSRILELGPSQQKQFQTNERLAFALARRHELTNDAEDLLKAIAYSVATIKLAPTGPLPGQRISMSDLAYHNLRIRVKAYFDETGDVPRIEESILKRGHIVQALLGRVGGKTQMANNTPTRQEELNQIKRTMEVAAAFERLYAKTKQRADIERALRLTVHSLRQVRGSDGGQFASAENSFRARYRLWSDHTGIMPECHISLVAWDTGDSYLAPELTDDLQLTTSATIFGGELPVPGEESEPSDDTAEGAKEWTLVTAAEGKIRSQSAIRFF